MAASTIVNCQVLYGEHNIASVTGSIDAGAECAMQDADNVAAGGYKTVIPGLTTSTASLSGQADFAAGSVHEALDGSIRGQQAALSLLLTGSDAVAGDAAIFTRGQLSAYSMAAGNVGDVAEFSIELEGDTAEVHGVVGAPLASRSSGLTGTAIQLGAVGTGPTGVTQRLWAALHVTAASGTNLAVTIESDDAVGFPSAATAATFSTVSATGWQFAVVDGPITDDWFRVSATIGSGSFTYAVLMGVL
jgi:hypothetical protein